jgi:hypothetical protein
MNDERNNKKNLFGRPEGKGGIGGQAEMTGWCESRQRKIGERNWRI